MNDPAIYSAMCIAVCSKAFRVVLQRVATLFAIACEDGDHPDRACEMGKRTRCFDNAKPNVTLSLVTGLPIPKDDDEHRGSLRSTCTQSCCGTTLFGWASMKGCVVIEVIEVIVIANAQR
jgi:hypothetical protein